MPIPSLLSDWIASAPGRAMNPDGHYGLQCVDLVDQYAQDIFGVPWPQSVGGVAGAKQLLDRVPDEFWIRTDNNPNDPNLIPSKGDVVVFSGSALNQWGHTAVVESADVNGMWVVQQDGFAQPLIWADGSWYSNKPAHRIWLGYTSNGTGPLAGWLTPKTHKLVRQDIVVNPASSVILAGHQRVSAAGVNQRTEPNRSGSVVKLWGPELVFDFKGYVRGENVDGNNIWYVGAYSDTYFWSGGFKDSSTNGLADLTPAPPVAPSISPTQRKVGSAVIRYRKAPNTGAEIIEEFEPGSVLNFSHWTRGQDVNGNNVWFKGAISGGYAWSGGFEDQSTNGLTEEATTTPAPAPAPTPSPTDPGNVTPPSYTFVKDFDFVEYRPAHITNVQAAYDNPGVEVFPPRPEKNVIHQFDARAKNPSIDGVINHFATERPGSESSAHFSVSGQRIVQHVSLKDRAYHAGRVGNNYVGIETDPDQDAETIASVKKLLKAINEKYGYELGLTLHKDVPGNSTNCGVEINLDDYKTVAPAPAPVPVPVPDPEPTPEPTPDEEVPVDEDEEFKLLVEAYLDSYRQILYALKK